MNVQSESQFKVYALIVDIARISILENKSCIYEVHIKQAFYIQNIPTESVDLIFSL